MAAQGPTKQAMNSIITTFAAQIRELEDKSNRMQLMSGHSVADKTVFLVIILLV